MMCRDFFFFYIFRCVNEKKIVSFLRVARPSTIPVLTFYENFPEFVSVLIFNRFFRAL